MYLVERGRGPWAVVDGEGLARKNGAKLQKILPYLNTVFFNLHLAFRAPVEHNGLGKLIQHTFTSGNIQRTIKMRKQLRQLLPTRKIKKVFDGVVRSLIYLFSQVQSMYRVPI